MTNNVATQVSGIETLRQHLMSTLADLRNKDAPMEVDRARAIAQVAGVLVDTAKVEVDFIRVTGADGSGFIPTDKAHAAPAAGESLPGVTSRVHRIR